MACILSRQRCFSGRTGCSSQEASDTFGGGVSFGVESQSANCGALREYWKLKVPSLWGTVWCPRSSRASPSASLARACAPGQMAWANARQMPRGSALGNLPRFPFDFIALSVFLTVQYEGNEAQGSRMKPLRRGGPGKERADLQGKVQVLPSARPPC